MLAFSCRLYVKTDSQCMDIYYYMLLCSCFVIFVNRVLCHSLYNDEVDSQLTHLTDKTSHCHYLLVIISITSQRWLQ